MKKKKNILLVWMMLITGETGLLCQTTLFNKSYDYHSHLETMVLVKELKQGYLAVMLTANAPDTCKRIILMRMDDSGDTLWTKTHFWLDSYVWLTTGALEETENGDFIMAGVKVYSELENDNGTVLKFNQDGELLWQKEYGELGIDAFLIKLDQEGEVIWQRIYGETWSTIHGSEPLELADGSIVVAGIQYINEDQIHASINKYDSAGTPLWSRLYAGENPYADNYLYGITSTEDGGFLAMGSTYDPNWTNFQEGWLLRLDSLGYTCNPVGCAEVLNTTAVEEAEVEGEAWSVYPNPSAGTFSLSWNGRGKVSLRLRTLTGQVVWSYEGLYEQSIEAQAGHLPAGLYLLECQAKEALHTQKLIIQL